MKETIKKDVILCDSCRKEADANHANELRAARDWVTRVCSKMVQRSQSQMAAKVTRSK